MLKPLRGLSRRDMLRLSSGALLTAGLWPGALSAADAPRSGRFDFIAINDLHHVGSDCTAWLERVVAQLRTHSGARFCLILGDLTDLGTRTSMEAVRGVFGRLGIPCHVQIGNHDYATQTDRSAYEAVFPKQLNYSFTHRGWQFVAVDSTEGQRYDKTHIQPATLEWLDSQLPRLNPRRPTILYTHFPMGEGVNYRPLNADALLDRFRPFNLRAVFSGHYHSLTERSAAGGLVLTTNRCCSLKRGNHDGSKEKGYFLCSVAAGEVTHRFIEVSPV